MAGFVVFIGAPTPREAAARLEAVVSSGAYGTVLRPPYGNRWRDSQEGTFADYSLAREGDSMFFFSRRKLYGIARLTNVGTDCKFLNFPGATAPREYSFTRRLKESLLLDWDDESHLVRWVCTFEPAPAMFREGVDIDDVLSSRPSSFRALRAMDNVTFGRIDDEEEQALRDVILLANESVIAAGFPEKDCFPDDHPRVHERIASRLTSRHRLEASPMLAAAAEPRGRIRHEMALEAGLVAQLATRDQHTIETFQEWDYLTHQVMASPFKPLGWADRMDVFGYRYMDNFAPTISRYLVAELKKDKAGAEEVAQVLKYVDWVREEYSRGDYSPIQAYLVAWRFGEDALDATEEAVRTYTVGRHPARTKTWADLSLVEYAFDRKTEQLHFSVRRRGIRD